MGQYEQMRALLLPLGLYRLDGTTLVDAELRAYAAGLTLLEERLAALRRNAWIQTADESGLNRWETLFGAAAPGASREERRQALLRRTAQGQGRWDRAAWFDALRRAGFSGTVMEYPGQYRIHLLFGAGPALFDCAAILRTAYLLAPAQIKCTVDLPPDDWDALDGQSRRWDAWDHASLRWELQEI